MKALLIVAAILTPGGCLLLAYVWLRKHWRQRLIDAELAAQIQPPRYVFTGMDEGLRKRTEARRLAADALKARANRVETGAKVSDVLRVVRG